MDEQKTAIDHLRTIRSLMERANVYRAVNVPTALFGGVMAIAAAWGLVEAERRGIVFSPEKLLLCWFAVLVLVGAFNTLLIGREAKKEGEPLWSPGMKMALKALLPALFAGGVLGAILAIRSAEYGQMAACWALFYGLALMATSGFSPRSLRVLGLAFTIIGLLFWALFLDGRETGALSAEKWCSIVMGLSFGLLHLIYGITVGLMQRRGS